MSMMVLLLGFMAAGGAGPATSLIVTNPSAITRNGETVVVPWQDIADRVPGDPQVRPVLADDEGRPVVCQVDDLDGNGTPDELVFIADFAPGQERRFMLSFPGKEQASPRVPASGTDAQNWKRVGGVLRGVDDDDCAGSDRDRKAYRFDGVGWESEIAAYRLYLDGRNAVDIQGKRKPGLYWKWIGGSDVDYQRDAEWGMDVLHVGPALGIGGIAFRVGDSVHKPLRVDRQRCRVLARGPVRAVVRVEYTGWDVGSGTADVTSLFLLAKGDRVTEHRVTVHRASGSPPLVAGIVKHDSTRVIWRPEGSLLCTIGHQSRANDTLLMALHAAPGQVQGRIEDTADHLLLLRYANGEPVRLLLWALWQGETGKMWNEEEITAFQDRTSRRLVEPLRVTVP